MLKPTCVDGRIEDRTSGVSSVGMGCLCYEGVDGSPCSQKEPSLQSLACCGGCFCYSKVDVLGLQAVCRNGRDLNYVR